MNPRTIPHQVRLTNWAHIIAERASSGMSVRTFCAEKQKNKKTYYHWRHLVRNAVCQKTNVASTPAVPVFAPISVPTAPISVPTDAAACKDNMLLRCGEFSLEITENTSPTLLRQTLRILHELQSGW